MNKKEFLMLAHSYADQDVTGWFYSRKLDGFAAVWDGGITRGDLAATVPWYNEGGDLRYKEAVKSTGLWSRRGKVIKAPDWWLNRLPLGIPVQGEIWSNDSRRESAVCNTKDVSDPRWDIVKMVVYNYKPYILWEQISKYGMDASNKYYLNTTFNKRYTHLLNDIEENKVLRLLDQRRLYTSKEVNTIANDALVSGWEGIMLTNPTALYEDFRSRNLLKVKAQHDTEVRVIDYREGKGRHTGRMGALICEVTWGEEVTTFRGGTDDMIGKTYTFHLGGGFADYEREWDYVNRNFPKDKVIKIIFNEIGVNGIPPTARLGVK